MVMNVLYVLVSSCRFKEIYACSNLYSISRFAVGLWSELLGDFQCRESSYPGVIPTDLPRQLANGHRLEKPKNNACSVEM